MTFCMIHVAVFSTLGRRGINKLMRVSIAETVNPERKVLEREARSFTL